MDFIFSNIFKFQTRGEKTSDLRLFKQLSSNTNACSHEHLLRFFDHKMNVCQGDQLKYDTVLLGSIQVTPRGRHYLALAYNGKYIRKSSSLKPHDSKLLYLVCSNIMRSFTYILPIMPMGPKMAPTLGGGGSLAFIALQWENIKNRLLRNHKAQSILSGY